ncbi:MAG TPA: hypothetical protein VGB54_12980, partial [Allosphingosinicella sp.]
GVSLMRLIHKTFLSALLLCGGVSAAPQAQAQAGVGYEPPPVEFAGPAETAQPAPSRIAPPEEQAPAPVRPARPRARVDVGGFVEVQQAVSAELGDAGLLGDDEVLTYTSFAAGVEGQVATRRVVASFGYRYERRVELTGDLPDDDVHSGIAQVSAQLVPGLLAVEAGGIATRTGGSGRAIGVSDRERSAEVYSGYAGPTLATRAGPVALNAFYRLGYVHVDDDSLAGASSPEGDFDATVHMAGASASMAPGQLPFGWNVSVGHVGERAGSFDTRFQSQFIRGDAVLPVNPSLALTAGVGYSRGEASQRDVQRGADGAPLVHANGNLIPDPARPRVTTYDQAGLFADAGFIWRPTRRTELQLRAGINDDGDPIVAGSAAFQVGRSFGFSFTLYDNDETFGTSLIRNLRDLPDEFKISRDPLTGDFSVGCVFSEDEPGRGACLSPALQSITGASFRARGGSILFSGSRRLWSFGGGITYARRDFYLPDDPIFESAFAPNDQDLALFGSVGRRIGRDAAFGFDGFLSFFNSDGANVDDVVSIGGRANFTRSFLLSRLQLLVALGLIHRSIGDENSLVADGLIGLRYTF